MLNSHYLLEFTLLLIVFISTPLRNLNWKIWLAIFTTTCILDIVSTLVDARLNNWDWTLEKNEEIRFLARYVGYGTALVLHNVILATWAYLLGKLLGKHALARYLIFVASVAKISAAIHNFFLPIIDLPRLFQ